MHPRIEEMNKILEIHWANYFLGKKAICHLIYAGSYSNCWNTFVLVQFIVNCKSR